MLDCWPIYNNAVLAKLCLCILWVSNFSSHKDSGNIMVSAWITAKAFAARLLLFLFIQSVRESEEGLTSFNFNTSFVFVCTFFKMPWRLLPNGIF